MCGIVGYVGPRQAAPILLDGLSKLEYRGYDSAGLAVHNGQSIEIVRRRIDELGTREPIIQRQGDDRIVVQVPGLADPERLKRLIGETAKMTFRLVDTSMSAEQALQGRPPPESEIVYGSKAENKQPYLLEKRVIVSGEELTVRVLPKQEDEFTCSRCFLVQHRSRLAATRGDQLFCRDCAA